MTLREYDNEVEAERMARSVFQCEEEERSSRGVSAKKKSLSIFKGVERSLATVLQSVGVVYN